MWCPNHVLCRQKYSNFKHFTCGFNFSFSTFISWTVIYFNFDYTCCLCRNSSNSHVCNQIGAGHSFFSFQPQTEIRQCIKYSRVHCVNQNVEFSTLIAELVFPSLWTKPAELLCWHITAVGSKTAVGAEERGTQAARVLGTEPVQGSGDTLVDMAYYTDRMRKDYSSWAWAFGNTWWGEENKTTGLVK